MFSRIVRQSSKFTQPSKFSFASTQGGNLYTWGNKSAGLGQPTSSTSGSILTPGIVEGFNNNVAKVAMGPSHSAVVTTEGDLYTMGYGHFGVLGQTKKTVSSRTPVQVEFFADNNIKVRDAVVGQYHTTIVTENNQIYSWGFGGQSRNPLANLFSVSYGALGLGRQITTNIPHQIEDFNVGKIVQITSGNNFVALLTENGDVYNWGVGRRGVFADDVEKNLKSPTLNEAIHHLREEKGIKPTKIKACGDFILALFDNGSLYGWGYNDLGQLGVKKEMGVEYYKVIEHPTKIDDANLNGQKILDFDCGEGVSAILTENNEVYWAGLKLVYQPQLADFPEGLKIKKVAVANPSVLALTEDNQIYTSRKLIPQAVEEINLHSFVIKPEIFGNGQILNVGGPYDTYYAIVRN